MDSPPSPPQSVAPPPSATPPLPPPPEAEAKEMVHRTKVIQFLGRTTPIVLQNDNGPCPLLAICNVLSLKNSLNLSPDIPEVSQEKLLSLVAERLIDSNSNIDNKDTGYVENQQQNIADAIDLLPRLTTGIDVNLKFRRIDDFEFTRECAIFDLLDIPLYHGWIVDPQDRETADAIGSKSYNTLMGELVSLETQTMESEQKKNTEEDSVDFVAATTAALGVPSPCLSRGQSFNESPTRARKGDIEEEAELTRALKLSEMNGSNSLAVDAVADDNLHGSAYPEKSELATRSETVEKNVTDETVRTETLISDDSNHIDPKLPEVVSEEEVSTFSKTDQESNSVEPNYNESTEYSGNLVEKTGPDAQVEDKNVCSLSFGQESPSSSDVFVDKSRIHEHAHNEFTSTSEPDKLINLQNGCKEGDSSSLLTAAADSDSSSGQMHKIDEAEAFTSSVDGSEPMYEGEECILESGTLVVDKNQEPVYEGEGVLAEQNDQDCMDNANLNCKDRISTKQGELIKNFMKQSASQLTIYGLFCLQDKVKERELCVFFRNNHFNTMFKYEGELYILATDQGYISQPDLVWEKLNEVNGDTLYMTGNFKEFKMDDHSDSTWNEQNAMSSTADYLASIDGATQENSSFNSDLQLAIALQQQEFDEQQQQAQQQQQTQQQTQRNVQQPVTIGSSGLITGPQVPRSSGKYTPSSSKQDSKSKDKTCVVM
ncbi:hypothetical protein ACJIZ3_004038 [Penstemon smallii]|uniref:MINDY deubiquitinase domain-containing protein n=1 Tax=Penstemon smallii TaxID=265156 RepID=A0ABD3S0Z1_9LAMI